MTIVMPQDTRWILFKVICCFASTNHLSKYIRERQPKNVVHESNQVLKWQSKLIRSSLKVQFLKSCVVSSVVPSHIWSRVSKTKPKDLGPIYRAFLRDEIAKTTANIKDFKKKYRGSLRACSRLSFVDRIQFTKLVSRNAENILQKIQRENEQNLNWLLKKQHGITEVQHSVCSCF